MMRPLLEVRDGWLTYQATRGSIAALRGVELTVEPGDFVGLRGPSGSGKSSLLFALAGLRQLTQGQVLFQGTPWSSDPARSADHRRRLVGLVFAEPFLVPYLTVRENVLQPALPEIPASRVDDLARAVGMLDLLDEWPANLSAGERQRASVLRALINGPPLVLADEPTAHLDAEAGRSVMRALRGMVGETTLIVASHDERVFTEATRVYSVRDGTLGPHAGT